MSSHEDKIKNILNKRFHSTHTTSALKHFVAAVEEFQKANWENSIIKIGKFIEAVTKMLWIYCNQPMPQARRFSVGNISDKLRNLSSYPDTIRILIPRACVFAYDIASNRGARHDPDEINPNKMDASITLPTASWILAELIRFANSGSSTPEQTLSLVESLIEKKYPYFEKIDGRTYINIPGLYLKDVALLILNTVYPQRIPRKELSNLLIRHGFKKSTIDPALTRLKPFIDEQDGSWKLRGIGREKAEEILATLNK